MNSIIKAKPFFCIDVTGLKLKEKPDFQKHDEFAEVQIPIHSPKSFLLNTNVTDTQRFLYTDSMDETREWLVQQ